MLNRVWQSIRCGGVNHACTVLVSAFLLFQVQPIVSKFILPWFGGSPAVWTTAMVFFQGLLFAGYAYAHLSGRWLSPTAQAWLHCLLIVAAIGLLPIAPDASWKPAGIGDGQPSDGPGPAWHIVCLLAATVGLPYFVLSSTGPLVQAWFARKYLGRSPYRLYALSNAGSLLALLSYPFVFEPAFDSQGQAWFWTLGFLLFAGLCGWGAWRSRLTQALPLAAEGSVGEGLAPGVRERLGWLLLPAFGSVMLLATTNHVCQDVAVMPFLWVVPLSLYLLTFIICFDHPAWYSRQGFGLAALFTLCLAGAIEPLTTSASGIKLGFMPELAIYFAALFLLCMVCHGEVVRLRPDPRHLTSFYLMISAGGALGGLLVSLAAPLVFDSYLEWKIGLVGGCLLAAMVALDTAQNSFLRRRFYLVAPALLVAFAGLNCGPGLGQHGDQTPVTAARNFYGVISVLEHSPQDPVKHRFDFNSGRIVHGLQFVDQKRRREPTAYYGRQSGIGRIMADLNAAPQRVGLVGLGVGTLAAYAKPGDWFHFYELNPDVVRFAQDHFHYLGDCRGRYDVVIGDARLSLESEPPCQFDLLVLDAFCGDAVPAHLLTQEAAQVYRRHLKPRGRIAVNISNRYLDLSGVVRGLGEQLGLQAVRMTSAPDEAKGLFTAEWMLLTPASRPWTAQRADAMEASPAPIRLWTDSHSNVFETFK